MKVLLLPLLCVLVILNLVTLSVVCLYKCERFFFFLSKEMSHAENYQEKKRY